MRGCSPLCETDETDGASQRRAAMDGLQIERFGQKCRPIGVYIAEFSPIFAQRKEEMNKLLVFSAVLCCLCLGACDLIEYHPYDTRVSGQRHVNEANVQRIEQAMCGRTSYRFAVISDTQRAYDETADAVRAINARGDVDFVIHCGDVSDFGATREFLWQRDLLNGFAMPYVCLLGNHDCLGTGEDVFSEVFGDPDFAFTVGTTRFICLNTNAMEYDYSHPVPDFDFIGMQLEHLDPSIGRTVFVMHVRPFEFQFNNNVAQVFQLYLGQFPGMEFCIYGHEHKLAADDLFGDGVIYYGCADIAKRSYLLFTVKGADYACETVVF